MNELTSRESLQQILDRRERTIAMSTAATVTAVLVALLLAAALVLDLAAAAPAFDATAAGTEAPPASAEGLMYSP